MGRAGYDKSGCRVELIHPINSLSQRWRAEADNSQQNENPNGLWVMLSRARGNSYFQST